MSLAETLRSHGIDTIEHAGSSFDDTSFGGASFDGTRASVVARPTSTTQVADAMRSAAELGAIVVATGNGTKQTWGAPPQTIDLLLDLSAMDQIVEHQPGDLIVTAQAGATIAAVNAAVAQADQRLVIDEMVPGTTIGGLIATNVSGPQRLYAGTTRDLLIGITFVRADGVVARSGGKVVKNVAGYDLGKLLTGSYGTLGVITEATFRLHPTPKATAWVSITVPPDKIVQTLRDANASQLAPAAIEAWGTGEQTHIAMLFAGTEQGVRDRVLAATRLLGTGATPLDRLDWPFQFPFQVGGSQLGLKVTCQLSAVAEVLACCREFGWEVRGSAGTGVLYVGVPQSDSTSPSYADRLTRLRDVAAGGTVVILDGPHEVREHDDLWGPVPGLQLMRRIKDEFDPGHRLSPGRFVGGI